MKNRKSNMKRQMLCFAASMAMVLGGGMQLYAAERMAAADTVYHNGTIYTMTESQEAAKDASNAIKKEVVATRDGKVVFVGSEQEARIAGYFDLPNVKIVDLQGKTMLPGFVDGHGHFPAQGSCDLYQVNLNSYPLGTMTCIQDYVDALQKKAKEIDDRTQLIVGYGYDDTLITEMAHPTRADLDEIDNPIIITHISGHMLVANSRALREFGQVTDAAGNATPADILEREELWNTPGVVLDEKGKPTGLLRETSAMNLVNKTFPSDPQKSLVRANQVYAAAGVTTADGGTSMIAGDVPTFQRGLLNGNLDLRVMFHPIGYLSSRPISGTANRSTLGWTGTDYLDGSNAIKIGSDISNLHVTQMGYELDVTNGATGAAYVNEIVPQLDKLQGKNKVILGAWKLMCDGSPQGYTGWMKYPGYYTLGDFEKNEETAGGTKEFSESNYYSGRFVGGNDLLNTRPEDIPLAIDIYHKYGQSTEMHLNGNASGEAWIAALERVVANNSYADVKDTRHTVIHAQFLERQQVQRQMGLYDQLMNKDENEKLYVELLGTMESGVPTMDFLKGDPGYTSDINVLAERMKAQNVFNSYFLTHTYFYGDRHKNIFFGPGRANQMSPAGWSVAYDQKYSFHNDTMVTPIAPLLSVQAALARTSATSKMWPGGTVLSGSSKDLSDTVDYPARLDADGNTVITQTYWDYDQRLNVLQALHGVTSLPAWQNKMEGKVGTIQTGAFADFTVLDEDPFTVAQVNPEKISHIRVTATIVGDEIVHGFLDTNTFAAAPYGAYIQQNDGITVHVSESNFVEKAEGSYQQPAEGSVRLGIYDFAATVEGGNVAMFQMDFLGNGSTVDGLRLMRPVSSTQSEEYTYSEIKEAAAGNWWICPVSDLSVTLKPSDTLQENVSYTAFFVIEDNDAYDSTKEEGLIASMIDLTARGNLPTNSTINAPADDDDGGSSSGCTVGSTPAYDLLVLLLGFSAIAIIRVARRRNS